MYIDNTWYGARYLFSKYCKVKNQSAFASIQHGHVLVKQKNLGKRIIKSTPWLVWNDKISNQCYKNKIKNVIPVGSIFIYLKKIYRFKKILPKGTLVFPLLSQPEKKNYILYEQLFSDLKKKFPKPYTISVSINDYKSLKKKFKRKKEINFVSWGYRGDINYLKKLYKSIWSHKKIFCVYPGSTLIYGLYLKKKVFLSKKFYLFTKDKNYMNKVRHNSLKSLNDFKDYGINLGNLNSKKNQKISKQILGEKYLKSPNELKKLLGWDSIYKIIIAKILSLIINIKEDFSNGLNYSKKRRIGRDFKN